MVEDGREAERQETPLLRVSPWPPPSNMLSLPGCLLITATSAGSSADRMETTNPVPSHSHLRTSGMGTMSWEQHRSKPWHVPFCCLRHTSVQTEDKDQKKGVCDHSSHATAW